MGSLSDLLKIQEETKDKKVVSNFRLYVEKFGIHDLLPSKQNSFFKEINVPAFNRRDFPELYDVTIKLDHNQVIKAHKCVLVSRLEYFHMMFMNSWAEVRIFFYYVLLTTSQPNLNSLSNPKSFHSAL